MRVNDGELTARNVLSLFHCWMIRDLLVVQKISYVEIMVVLLLLLLLLLAVDLEVETSRTPLL